MKFTPKILADWQKTVIDAIKIEHCTDSESVNFLHRNPFSVLCRNNQYIVWDKNGKITFKVLASLIEYVNTKICL